MMSNEFETLIEHINEAIPSGFKIRAYLSPNSYCMEIKCHDINSKSYVPCTIPVEVLQYEPRTKIIDIIMEGMEKLPRYKKYLMKKNTKLGKILYK